MNCQTLLKDNEIQILEMCNIKKIDLVAISRTELGEEEIYIYPFEL